MSCDPMLGTIYCVLDGLDECDEVLLEDLLRQLKALFSNSPSDSSSNHLKLIVFSRELPDFIQELLSGFPHIRLDPDADNEVNQDINRFIDVVLDDLSLYRQYPEALYMKVKKVFHDRGQGTFLWVGIVAKTLRRYKATEVEKALNDFPPGLEELYARILLQIDVDRREIAAKMLRWVVLAVRPLTLSELSTAVESAVEPSSAFNCDDVIRDQISYCGYLLTIKEHTVSLIHQSAKDYLLRGDPDPNPELESFRVKEKVGHGEIARKCFHYLQNSFPPGREVNTSYFTSQFKAFPLLSYAARYWPVHARSLSRSDDIFDLSLSFYRKKSRVRDSWLETYRFLMDSNVFNVVSPGLLHVASWFGILPLIENLLTQKGFTNRVQRFRSINKKDSNGGTALTVAAQSGHLAIVQLLLEKGADIEAKDILKETALMKAVRGGYFGIVQLLLKKGADVEAKDRWNETATIKAAEYGYSSVVQLLLEKGADVEAKNKWNQTALIRAARDGHLDVVQLLLEKGADIEAKDRLDTTALIKAALNGNKGVVQLLLEKGANIDAKDKRIIDACRMR